MTQNDFSNWSFTVYVNTIVLSKISGAVDMCQICFNRVKEFCVNYMCVTANQHNILAEYLIRERGFFKFYDIVIHAFKRIKRISSALPMKYLRKTNGFSFFI